MTIITINQRNYIKYSDIKETYGLTADRIKKWREGKGAGKITKLNYIKLDRGLYIYDLLDLEALILTHRNINIIE